MGACMPRFYFSDCRRYCDNKEEGIKLHLFPFMYNVDITQVAFLELANVVSVVVYYYIITSGPQSSANHNLCIFFASWSLKKLFLSQSI